LVRVNTELGLFDSALAKKPQLVAINKIDLPEVRERQAGVRDDFSGVGISPRFISAVTGEGVSELVAAAVKVLERVTVDRGTEEKVSKKVFHPRPRGAKVSVRRDGGTFVVVAPELERILDRVDISRPVVYSQVRRELDRLGVSQALRKAGVEPGDKVRCGGTEWAWQ
jgi:GTP-binding protein